MSDINDDYFDESERRGKKRNEEIDERKKYLSELSFEDKVEIMFEQFKKDEFDRIWNKYCKKY